MSSKPKLTKADRKYAAKLNERLLQQYGVGMATRQCAAEIGISTRSVTRRMNHYGFKQFDPKYDKRYSTDEVTAIMTLYYHRRNHKKG